MMRLTKLKCEEFCQLVSVAVATLALLVATDFAEAGTSRKERSIESITTRAAGEPIMAIVSLRSQRITVYDADGWIMRAAVSSGQAGRETPAGIFSVIQKDAEDHSDAYMPPIDGGLVDSCLGNDGADTGLFITTICKQSFSSF